MNRDDLPTVSVCGFSRVRTAQRDVKMDALHQLPKYVMDDDIFYDPRTGKHSSIPPSLLAAWHDGRRRRMQARQAEIDAAFEAAKSDPALHARLNKPLSGK